MAVVEGLLLEVGSQVASLVLRIWVRHRDRVVGEAETVADVLARAVPGQLPRRRVGRQFDQLAERVASKLEPFVEVEFAGLPEGERVAAAEALATAFSLTESSIDDLIGEDLNPHRLRAAVRAAAPDATRDLSEDAAALYELLLQEACSYVVDLVAALPQFSVLALRELLERETAIIDMLQRNLEFIDALADLPSLRFVDLTGTAVTDLRMLERQRGLTLRFDDCQEVGADVEWLVASGAVILVSRDRPATDDDAVADRIAAEREAVSELLDRDSSPEVGPLASDLERLSLALGGEEWEPLEAAWFRDVPSIPSFDGFSDES